MSQVPSHQQEHAIVSETWIHFSQGNFIIALRSQHGGYLRADPSSEMSAEPRRIQDFEKYRVHSLGNNQIALKSCHDKFLCAEGPNEDSRFVNDRDQIGPWETFHVIAAHGEYEGKYALLTHHNRYVSAQPDGDVEINRTAVGLWEVFDIQVIGAPRTLPPIAVWLNDFGIPQHFHSLVSHGIDTPRKLTKLAATQLTDLGIPIRDAQTIVERASKKDSNDRLTLYVKERAWYHLPDPLMRGIIGRIGKHCIRLGDCPSSHSVLLLAALKNLDVNIVLVNTSETPEWFLRLGEPSRKRELMNVDEWKELPDTPVLDDGVNGKRIFMHSNIIEYLDQNFEPPAILGEDVRPPRMNGLLGAMIWSIRAAKDFENDEEKIEEGKANLMEVLMLINSHLGKNDGPFLNGEQITFADLDILPKLYQYEIVVEKLNEYVYPRIRRYLDHVYSQEWWSRYLYTPQAVLDGWKAKNIID